MTHERAPSGPWPLVVLSLAGALGACAEAPEPVAVELVPLSPREQLIRLSMDLRGIHPTEVELAAIDAAPGLYSDFVERYLTDPRFLDRMIEVYDLAWHTRAERLYLESDRELTDADAAALADELGEEPLRLLRHVIANDLPYTDVVTAPFSFATPRVASYWDMTYPEGADGWQISTYHDGRPHAGVLTMSTFWQRYPSMGGNANRHRANAISRVFLCDDFLMRPIVVNRTAVDQLALDPEDAIRTNDTCQSCHASLDPLASNLFGFFNDFEGLEEGRVYRAEGELQWQQYSGRSPGYFGRPTANLTELGQQVADDPRFVRCAVQTAFEGLNQRDAGDPEWPEIEKHLAAFEEGDLSVRALVRSIVSDPLYVAAAVRGDEELAARLPTVRTASPRQLADTIHALTGYRWSFGGREALKTNTRGLNVLAGGVDDVTVLNPSYLPAVGAAFVHERLAQAAAWHVVQHDLSPDREDDARLLVYVGVDDDPTSNPEGFRLQIRELYLRITGIPLPEGAPEETALVDLWVSLHSMSASSADAWAGVVSAVLRDPRVLFY